LLSDRKEKERKEKERKEKERKEKERKENYLHLSEREKEIIKRLNAIGEQEDG
jgi:hypothetical protein